MDLPTGLSERTFREGDEAFVERLLRRAVDDPTRGIGYPRCRDWKWLLEELRIFGQGAPEAFFVLEREGAAVGAFGLLVAPRSSGGFLVGPLLADEAATTPGLRDALRLAERRASSFLGQLRASVSEGNDMLAAALEEAGWSRQERHLEMWRRPGRRAALEGMLRREALVVDPARRRLVGGAAALLQRVHGWSQDARTQVERYLAEGYRLGVVRSWTRAVVACLLWREAAGEGCLRIEWLCSAPRRRREGLASALLAQALSRSVTGFEEAAAWLTVRDDNAAAVALFAKFGFVAERASVIHGKELDARAAPLFDSLIRGG